MKRHTSTIIAALTAPVLGLTAVAEQTTIPTATRPESAQQQPACPAAARLNGAAKSSDVIGMVVSVAGDEKIGKVDDLAVDVESGRILQVILSTGGFIGIGDRLTAVPPGALHYDAARRLLRLNVDKEALKSAPAFDMGRWAELSDSEHLAQVYKLYGEESAYVFVQNEPGMAGLRVHTNSAPNTAAADRPMALRERGHIVRDSRSMIPASRLSQVQRLSTLMGTPITNLQNEKLGKLENVLLDLPSGRLVAMIISSGGFLGMGNELSAVPPTALRFTRDRDGLLLDTSKEALSSAPHFKADQWPDAAQPAYADAIYRAFRVEPYFTTNAVTDADAVANTIPRRDNSNLTPLDQGNSKADLDTTAQIRQEIMAGKNMSMNAKNVKVITIAGHVTLRGPVNTADEKRLIGEIADHIARSENVDNQLEIQLITSSNN
jgi:sporulation protein YlmC with PRC-barrel domain